MKQTIRLYLTTRSDPQGDLDDVKTADGLLKWRQKTKKNALETKEYPELSDEIIEEIREYAIKECYAVIAYPPGRMNEADDLVGEELLKFLKRNSQRLNWQLEETGVSAITVAELSERNKRLTSGTLWDNFTYGLIADKRLGPDEYETDLEVIVAEQ
jgi:hypothetical protein